MERHEDDTFAPMWRRVVRDPLLPRVRAAEARGSSPNWWVQDGRIRVDRLDGRSPTAGTSAPVAGLGPVALPLPANTFVGRTQECREVAEAVTEHPLVTISGPPGVGKTRLALEVASGLQDAFHDGVVWVDLSGVTEPALVAMEVAARLGLQDGTAGLVAGEQQDVPFARRLAERLATRNLLVVLETFDHVRSGCRDLLAALTAVGATLHVLCAGSPVGSPRERVIDLRPLPVPVLARPTINETLASDAVKLFLDRSGLHGGTPLTDEQVLLVGRICRRLHGVPHGIELAAARAGTLPLEQILHRLDDLVELSSTVSRSYALLTPVQQLLLRRLSVFRGGFTTQAAVAVCSGNGLDASLVRSTLAELRGSGVVLQDLYLSCPRNSLVETARKFAEELLLDSGEHGAVRTGHRIYFRALADRAGPVLHSAEQFEMLDAMELEHDNFRAALEFHDADGANAAVEILCALHRYFVVRGHLSEERAHINRVLRSGRGSVRAHTRALALAARAAMTYGDLDEGRRHAAAALVLARSTGDRVVEGVALGELGVEATHRGRLLEAEELLRRSMTLARKTVGEGDPARLSRTLLRLGSVARARGDLHGARRLYTQALERDRELGDYWDSVWALYWLGCLDIDEEAQRSKEPLEEGLDLARRLGSRQATCLMLVGLGKAAFSRGDYTLAESNYAEALAVADDLDDDANRRLAQEGLIRIALVTRDPRVASANGVPRLTSPSLMIRRGLAEVRRGGSESSDEFCDRGRLR